MDVELISIPNKGGFFRPNGIKLIPYVKFVAKAAKMNKICGYKVPYATDIGTLAKEFNRLKGYVSYCI
jgi:hypothetical protein